MYNKLLLTIRNKQSIKPTKIFFDAKKESKKLLGVLANSKTPECFNVDFILYVTFHTIFYTIKILTSLNYY